MFKLTTGCRIIINFLIHKINLVASQFTARLSHRRSCFYHFCCFFSFVHLCAVLSIHVTTRNPRHARAHLSLYNFNKTLYDRALIIIPYELMTHLHAPTNSASWACFFLCRLINNLFYCEFERLFVIQCCGLNVEWWRHWGNSAILRKAYHFDVQYCTIMLSFFWL